jgi:hypothetical protein
MGALDLIAKAAKGVKKAGPFFSKADVILDELQRGKGTGDEFLTELVKKGVKPTELKDRGLDKALKGKPKMTKAEVQKVFQEKAPPRIRDEIRGGDEYQRALDEKAQEMIGDENVGFDDLYGRDKERAEAAVRQEYGYDPETQYGEYVTPGGTNYREILLKIPQRGLNEIDKRNLMLYEGDIRRGKELDPWHQKQYEALKEKEAAGSQDYQSVHFKDTPNILAHIRVQDFVSPTYTKQQAEEIGQRIADGMGIADPKNLGSGSIRVAINNGYVTPKEAAQYADFRKFQGIDTTGAKQKVLLVDELQSDWHQEGRKKGYIDPDKKPYTIEQDQNGVYRIRNLNGERFDPFVDGRRMSGFMTAEGAENAMRGNMGQLPQTYGVPDAPFKKNWHELAMKRVLDYAAENGYDTVAITPGAEQAKRYDLSKQIDSIAYDPETRLLDAWDHNRRQVMRREITDESQLEDYIGKEAASKLLQAEPVRGKHLLEGQDLQVGGEGMKGFYDKILPDYLNNYGKKYGAQMGEMKIEVGSDMGRGPNDEFLGRVPIYTNVHSFDITPQMREEIKTKGQPLYSKIGVPGAEATAAAGAATMGSQMFDENNEQSVQNPVHFTENPDAMLLELMQRN